MRFITVLLMVFFVSISLHADEIEVGDVSPSFIGKTLDNKKIELSEMTDKVVVVTFWASWCGPCLRELPVLDAIQKLVSTDHLQVVAVNFGEAKRNIKHIMQQLPESNIQFAQDPRKYSSNKYYVKGIPHMVIIDRQGKVAHIHIGYGDGTAERLSQELYDLLRRQPAQSAT